MFFFLFASAGSSSQQSTVSEWPFQRCRFTWWMDHWGEKLRSNRQGTYMWLSLVRVLWSGPVFLKSVSALCLQFYIEAGTGRNFVLWLLLRDAWTVQFIPAAFGKFLKLYIIQRYYEPVLHQVVPAWRCLIYWFNTFPERYRSSERGYWLLIGSDVSLHGLKLLSRWSKTGLNQNLISCCGRFN